MKSRKLISILLTLSLLVTMLIPLAAPAMAVTGSADSIQALTTPTTKDDIPVKDLTHTGATLGTILLKTTAGAAYNGNIFTVRLPEDYEFPTADYTGTFASAAGDVVSAPARYDGNDNAFDGCNFVTSVINDNEIHIQVSGAVDAGDPGYVLVKLAGIGIPSGADKGDITAVVTSPISQGFPSGEVVVGKITGGEVQVSVDEVKTFIDESSPITLRFKETVAGSFEDSSESIKLRLPNGFTWDTPATATDLSLIWGHPTNGQPWLNNLQFRVDDRDLYINTTNSGVTDGGIYFSLQAVVKVDDEAVAKYGDVKVTFGGDTDCIPSDLVIAKYNDMGANITAENTTTVVAGKLGEEIGDVVVEETAPGTFADTRTITLTLPSYAKWSKEPDVDEDGVTLEATPTFVGTDGRTLKYKIDSPSNGDPGTLKFKDAEVLLSGDASGNLEIEVGGTAGAEGKVEVAEVKAPVEAKADGTAPEVKIGMNEQGASDFTVTELDAESINNDDLEINLPTGVEWNDVPTIEVTEGDIVLEEATTDGGKLTIPVRATSSTPATIKFSNVKLDIDRTVAEGDINAKVSGIAVNEVNDEATLDDNYADNDPYWDLAGVDGHAFRDTSRDGAFPNVGTVAKCVIAKVATPAPVDQKKSAKFVIGDTNFSVNGVDYTMDVAPYVKDGRTYLPVRFVAQALGVADSNILWDNATQKVTLIKNGTVVQLTIGSNVMLVNGSAITMDVPAEITSDRTMLPFRFIAQAFGANVGWDEATQTVTMDLM